MTVEEKHKIKLLIIDLQEYIDGNSNITEVDIARSLNDIKAKILRK